MIDSNPGDLADTSTCVLQALGPLWKPPALGGNEAKPLRLAMAFAKGAKTQSA